MDSNIAIKSHKAEYAKKSQFPVFWIETALFSTIELSKERYGHSDGQNSTGFLKFSLLRKFSINFHGAEIVGKLHNLSISPLKDQIMCYIKHCEEGSLHKIFQNSKGCISLCSINYFPFRSRRAENLIVLKHYTEVLNNINFELFQTHFGCLHLQLQNVISFSIASSFKVFRSNRTEPKDVGNVSFLEIDENKLHFSAIINSLL